jgi:hypothetical protein
MIPRKTAAIKTRKKLTVINGTAVPIRLIHNPMLPMASAAKTANRYFPIKKRMILGFK